MKLSINSKKLNIPTGYHPTEKTHSAIVKQTGHYDFRTTAAANSNPGTGNRTNPTNPITKTTRDVIQHQRVLINAIPRYIYGPSRRKQQQNTPKSYGTAPAAFRKQFQQPFGKSNDKDSSDEADDGDDVPTDTSDKECGSNPHHVSKQIESLQKSYYEKINRFYRKDTSDFDSNLSNYKRHLRMHNVNRSIWVHSFPIMLT